MAVDGPAYVLPLPQGVQTAPAADNDVADPKNVPNAYLVGVGAGMDTRLEPARHGFMFDIW